MNRVFTTILQQTLAPAAVGGTQFRINNLNRTAILKSLTFDILIRTANAPVSVLPLELNTTQDFLLQIQALPLGTLFTQIYEEFTVPIVAIANGNFFFMFKPQHLEFESFFIRNTLLYTFTYTNRDLLLNYIYIATVITEIEDIEKQ